VDLQLVTNVICGNDPIIANICTVHYKRWACSKAKSVCTAELVLHAYSFGKSVCEA